ncbi:MAG: HAMP domain-containing sensor histidine kinase [Chloroflexi bacterium]|nr:HAMP domain-containing sensor histidine kinase [Chloroflexota bacterium]
MQRLFRSLGTRLIITHILVAIAVLVVIGALLLASVPSLQRALTFRGLVSNRQASLLVNRQIAASQGQNNQAASRQSLFQALQDQAETQAIRILLINPATQKITFDTANRLAGTTWLESLNDDTAALRWWQRLFNNRLLASNRAVRNQTIRNTVRLEDELWFYVAGPLPAGRRTDPLFLVVMRARIPLWQTLRTLTEEMPPLLIVSVLFAILVMIYLLSAWVAGSVTRSLAPVIAGTQQLAAGNQEYRVPVDRTSLQEVTQLAVSFNRMAERVQQSQQAQREFVANISHDLKTPLTSIQGFAQALIDGAATNPATQARAAEIIHTEAQRLSKLVNALLEAVNLDSGQLQFDPQPLDLNQNLSDLFTSYLARSENSGITLQWQPFPAPLMVNADLNYLPRVFTNLLDNAFSYTPRGGQITVQAQQISEPAKAGAFVEVSIADTGKGIPAADLPYIFDRFYQVDKSRSGKRGFGLGLSIVRGIVEAHGGTVGVMSVENLGSRFWVRLPLRPILE